MKLLDEPTIAGKSPDQETAPELPAGVDHTPVQVGWNGQGQRGKVLFVDDDQAFLEMCARRFESSDYEVVASGSAEQALKMMADEAVDVVVSDMSMPGMNGTELLQAIHKQYPDVIRIIISGKFDMADTIDAINRGHVHRYIVKPFNDKDLKLTIYQAILEREKTKAEEKRKKERQDNVKQRAKELGRVLADTKRRVEQSYDEVIDVLTALSCQMGTGVDKVLVGAAVEFARTQSLPPGEIEQIRVAAMLRDIALLGQPHVEGTMRHATDGGEILERLRPYQVAARIISCHHEYFDGSGFPLGLQGDDIPLGARVLVLIQDYVDERRQGVCHDDAIKVLSSVSHRYDTKLLAALAALPTIQAVAH